MKLLSSNCLLLCSGKSPMFLAMLGIALSLVLLPSRTVNAQSSQSAKSYQSEQADGNQSEESESGRDEAAFERRKKRNEERMAGMGNPELRRKMMQQRMMRNQNADSPSSKKQSPKMKNAGKQGAAKPSAGNRGKGGNKNAGPASDLSSDKSMEQRTQQLLRMLGRADKNKDQKLSREEAPAMMKERFDRIDQNSDGFIDLPEVKAMLQVMQQRMGNATKGKDGEKSGPNMQEMRKRMMQRGMQENESSGLPVKPIRPGTLK